ncbi:hypothetical protein F4604DRAFT_1695708 [Suillus subluteus]|nr:hypothetical protein F4604DRAFT_1695708 [Suillus subluteus]
MARSESPIVVAQSKKIPLDKAEVMTYKQWLQNNSHQKQALKSLIKYGRHWTARQVLVHTHNALIRKETGEMAGSEEMISKWPKAAKTIINCLSVEEKEEAQAMAEKWNNEVVLPEVQAQVTETKGADMIEHFVMEMFKKAGMRVFVLSVWKNRKGKLMLGGHDFNDQFANSESFMKTRDWEGIFMPEWQDYVGEQFGEKLLIRLLEDMLRTDVQTPRKCVVSFCTWDTLLTGVGMCGGEDNMKAVVPWGDRMQSQASFFDSTQWPAGVQFKEPSKMDKADATALLEFWFTRQENNIQPPFAFKA